MSASMLDSETRLPFGTRMAAKTPPPSYYFYRPTVSWTKPGSPKLPRSGPHMIKSGKSFAGLIPTFSTRSMSGKRFGRQVDRMLQEEVQILQLCSTPSLTVSAPDYPLHIACWLTYFGVKDVVIVDAGSGGTRARLYRWQTFNSGPPTVIKPLGDQPFKQVWLPYIYFVGKEVNDDQGTYRPCSDPGHPLRH